MLYIGYYSVINKITLEGKLNLNSIAFLNYILIIRVIIREYCPSARHLPLSLSPPHSFALPTCVCPRHVFHKMCVDPWLNEHCTCPMCKLNILKALGIMVSVLPHTSQTHTHVSSACFDVSVMMLLFFDNGI